MVTQPAQDQAFPLKALITLKPEGSVSRRKTIIQTLDKGPCGKIRRRGFSCIRVVLTMLSNIKNLIPGYHNTEHKAIT